MASTTTSEPLIANIKAMKDALVSMDATRSIGEMVLIMASVADEGGQTNGQAAYYLVKAAVPREDTTEQMPAWAELGTKERNTWELAARAEILVSKMIRDNVPHPLRAEAQRRLQNWMKLNPPKTTVTGADLAIITPQNDHVQKETEAQSLLTTLLPYIVQSALDAVSAEFIAEERKAQIE